MKSNKWGWVGYEIGNEIKQHFFLQNIHIAILAIMAKFEILRTLKYCQFLQKNKTNLNTKKKLWSNYWVFKNAYFQLFFVRIMVLKKKMSRRIPM